MTSSPEQPFTLPVKLACSAVAAVSGVVVGYPLDTMKTRLQILGNKAKSVPKGSLPQYYYPALYSSTLNCVTKTVRHEGARGLFKGLTVTMLGQAPIFGIDTGKVITKIFKPPSPDKGFSFGHWASATCISGGVTTLVMTPAERIKCILQIQASGTNHHHHEGARDCAKQLWRVGGIRNLYKGVGIIYLRGIAQAGVYIGTCDKITDMMKPSHRNVSPNRAMITGGLTGMLVWTAILPIDIVKTIVQTAPEGSNKSVRQIATDLIRREGIKAFYRGLVPVAIRAMIGNIAMFSSFRWMQSLLMQPKNSGDLQLA